MLCNIPGDSIKKLRRLSLKPLMIERYSYKKYEDLAQPLGIVFVSQGNTYYVGKKVLQHTAHVKKEKHFILTKIKFMQ